MVRSIQEHFECMMKVNWVCTSSTVCAASSTVFSPNVDGQGGEISIVSQNNGPLPIAPSPVHKLSKTGTRIYCVNTVCESKKSC